MGLHQLTCIYVQGYNSHNLNIRHLDFFVNDNVVFSLPPHDGFSYIKWQNTLSVYIFNDNINATVRSFVLNFEKILSSSYYAIEENILEKFGLPWPRYLTSFSGVELFYHNSNGPTRHVIIQTLSSYHKTYLMKFAASHIPMDFENVTH